MHSHPLEGVHVLHRQVDGPVQAGNGPEEDTPVDPEADNRAVVADIPAWEEDTPDAEEVVRVQPAHHRKTRPRLGEEALLRAADRLDTVHTAVEHDLGDLLEDILAHGLAVDIPVGHGVDTPDFLLLLVRCLEQWYLDYRNCILHCLHWQRNRDCCLRTLTLYVPECAWRICVEFLSGSVPGADRLQLFVISDHGNGTYS